MDPQNSQRKFWMNWRPFCCVQTKEEHIRFFSRCYQTATTSKFREPIFNFLFLHYCFHKRKKVEDTSIRYQWSEKIHDIKKLTCRLRTSPTFIDNYIHMYSIIPYIQLLHYFSKLQRNLVIISTGISPVNL